MTALIHNGSRTSRAAAESMRECATTLRQQVYQYILDKGFNGATADEIEHRLKIPGNTVRPRIVELRNSKHIIDSNLTRPTRSGREAVVWWVNLGETSAV